MNPAIRRLSATLNAPSARKAEPQVIARRTSSPSQTATGSPHSCRG